MPTLSAVNLDSIESVSTALLRERLGRLSDERFREVWVALAVADIARPVASKAVERAQRCA